MGPFALATSTHRRDRTGFWLVRQTRRPDRTGTFPGKRDCVREVHIPRIAFARAMPAVHRAPAAPGILSRDDGRPRVVQMATRDVTPATCRISAQSIVQSGKTFGFLAALRQRVRPVPPVIPAHLPAMHGTIKHHHEIVTKDSLQTDRIPKPDDRIATGRSKRILCGARRDA